MKLQFLNRKYLVWYAKFCVYDLPFVMALYIPYQIFVLHLSFHQFETWTLTAGIMFLISNLLMSPYFNWVMNRLGAKPN